MLAAADVPGYLLDRNLIDARAIVDGALRVADLSRGNRVFLVTAEDALGLVLKLAGDDGDAVAHEAEALERLRSVPGLAPFLPAPVAYDTDEAVLVVEAAPAARDLVHHHRAGRFSVALARAAGTALGTLHALPPAALGGLAAPTSPDWRLGVHRPRLADVHTMSTSALDLVEILQRADDLCGWLDELCADWRAESAVHGDVRWDNCLAVRDGSGRWSRLLLVDWEMAGPGDPAEDVGAFLGEYLRAWVGSIPDLDPRKRLATTANARYPLGRMQPALRAFWDAYASRRRRPGDELGATLRRATRFAAARLVAGALEEAQMLPVLHAGVLNAVQLGRAVLRRPDEAAAQLLGLGASRAAA